MRAAAPASWLVALAARDPRASRARRARGAGARRRRTAAPPPRRSQATLVDPDGDGALARGPGEPLRDRTELGGGGRPGEVLATLAQLTDAARARRGVARARAVPRPPGRRLLLHLPPAGGAQPAGARRRGAGGQPARARCRRGHRRHRRLRPGDRARPGARGARRRERRPRHGRARATTACSPPTTPIRSSTAPTSTPRATPGCSSAPSGRSARPASTRPWCPPSATTTCSRRARCRRPRGSTRWPPARGWSSGSTRPSCRREEVDSAAAVDALLAAGAPGARPARPRRSRAPAPAPRRADRAARRPPRRSGGPARRRGPADAGLRRRPRRRRPRCSCSTPRPRRRLARPAAPGAARLAARASCAAAAGRAIVVSSAQPARRHGRRRGGAGGARRDPRRGRGRQRQRAPQPDPRAPHGERRLLAIATASLADFPQQARALRLRRTPARLRAGDVDDRPRRRGPAGTARELAFLDAQGGRPQGFAGGAGTATRGSSCALTPLGLLSFLVGGSLYLRARGVRLVPDGCRPAGARYASGVPSSAAPASCTPHPRRRAGGSSPRSWPLPGQREMALRERYRAVPDRCCGSACPPGRADRVGLEGGGRRRRGRRDVAGRAASACSRLADEISVAASTAPSTAKPAPTMNAIWKPSVSAFGSADGRPPPASPRRCASSRSRPGWPGRARRRPAATC